MGGSAGFLADRAAWLCHPRGQIALWKPRPTWGLQRSQRPESPYRRAHGGKEVSWGHHNAAPETGGLEAAAVTSPPALRSEAPNQGVGKTSFSQGT